MAKAIIAGRKPTSMALAGAEVVSINPEAKQMDLLMEARSLVGAAHGAVIDHMQSKEDNSEGAWASVYLLKQAISLLEELECKISTAAWEASHV